MPSVPTTETGTTRPLVIVNPTAGRGRTGRDLPRITRALEDALGAIDLGVTSRAGEAREMAAVAAGERRPLVIGVGGDGTLNEVVNGLLDASADTSADLLPALGIVTTGTGGDYRRTLGVGTGPELSIAALAGQDRLVDVGWARYTGRDGAPVERHWINVLSAGIGGLVDRYSAAAPGFVGGRVAYGQAALRAIVTCRRTKLRCSYVSPDGQERERLLDSHAVAICNGRTFGGGMNVAPMAELDDGLLEVIAFETSTRWRLVRRFATVYAGTHVREPGVNHFTCRSLRITPHEEGPALAGSSPSRSRRDVFPLDVDGDALGDVPLEVGLRPKALRVRVPRARGGA